MRTAALALALGLLSACATSPGPSGPAPGPATADQTRAPAGWDAPEDTPLADAIRARRAEVAGCYEAALKDDPALEGTVLLRLTLGAGGAVVDAAAPEGSLASEPVRRCIVEQARGWSLPVPEPEGVVVELPLRFVPVPDEGETPGG